MKIETSDLKLVQKGLDWYIGFIVPNHLIDKIKKLTEKDCVKSVEIKQKRNKRSISANNYMWQLINQMAIKLGSTDVEIYERMLCDFGTKEYVVAVPEARPILLKAYKIVEVVSSVKIKNKPAVQFRLIRGSSSYDTKEMSILINGVVQEAKVLGIETMNINEIKLMMES